MSKQIHSDYSSRLISYTWSWITVGVSSKQVQANCNEIGFYNQGTNTYLIDGQRQLLPGQEIVFSGWAGEIDLHTYELTSLGGGGTNWVVIRMKIYQKFEGQP